MIIEKVHQGMRIDRYLCGILNLPHSLASRLLRKKVILLNGRKAEINTRLSEGDEVKLPSYIKFTSKEIKRGEGFISIAQLDEFKKNIIYEEEGFLVINKPSGLATQGGSGIKISVDEYIYHLNPEFRLVHRIDKETSGCLIVAKTRASATKLAADFQNKNIQKVYIAVTLGIPSIKEGKIDSSLLRETGKAVPVSVNEKGKLSTTYYKVLEEKNGYATFELILETGRMHQIRAHLSSINCKIVGDNKYGDITSKMAICIKPKMLLHAFSIEYNNKKFISPLPSYFKII